ncbi:hypothetical protein JW879_02520 [candidate division WOR-3 bacterium]|nr:hypothetical protein [candidate division WOR-3 bacterium]
MFYKKSFFSIAQILLLVILFVGSFSCCRKEPEAEVVEVEEARALDECLERQGSLKFDESIPQHYNVTSTLYNRELGGGVVSSMQIKASFVRSVEEKEVICRWNNVRMFSTRDTEGEFPDGKPLDYMEGFTYSLSDTILTEEFYEDFPEEDRTYMKTLIWDAPWLELAYVAVDSIEYNKPYFSEDLETKEVEAQNFALLKTKNLKLIWSGVAKKDGEECALLEFKSLSNPVESEKDVLSVKGRSCCWGSFWVSLNDHQIEYAVINEDLIMEMSVSGKPIGQVLNMQRELVFDKTR